MLTRLYNRICFAFSTNEASVLWLVLCAFMSGADVVRDVHWGWLVADAFFLAIAWVEVVGRTNR